MSNTQTHELNIENILFQAHLCRVELYHNSREYRKATNELLDIISERLVKNMEIWFKAICLENLLLIFSLECLLKLILPFFKTQRRIEFGMSKQKEYYGLNHHRIKHLRTKILVKQERRCAGCNRVLWGTKEKFDLHHINGNAKDNRIANLQVLCKVCHFQIHDFTDDEERAVFKRNRKTKRSNSTQTQLILS